jgi:hypothetical protein
LTDPPDAVRGAEDSTSRYDQAGEYRKISARVETPLFYPGFAENATKLARKLAKRAESITFHCRKLLSLGEWRYWARRRRLDIVGQAGAA